MEKLKPCPFCAHDASMSNTAPDAWWICCDSNDCCAEGPVRGDEAAAITAWNTRK